MSVLEINGVIAALASHRSARVVATATEHVKRIELSFADLHRMTAAAAGRIASRGVVAGDRVGILAPNSVEWIAVDLACLAIGAISVPFDPAYQWEVTPALLDEWDLRLLVTDLQTSAGRVLAMTGVADGHGALPPARHAAETDVITVKFSSGTSAAPKAVDATPRHINHVLTHVARMFPLGPDDLFLVAAPLSTWLQRVMVQLAILQGASVCLTRPDRIVAALDRERPTIVLGVPRLLETVHAVHKRRSTSDPSARLSDTWGGRLRYLWTGSAPIDRAVLEACEEGGVPVFEGYGMTETGFIAKNYPGHRRIGSVGPLFPGIDLRTDEDGELLVRSEFAANSHYWRGTGEAFRSDGWIGTGDVGYLDGDGFLFLEGRAKDAVVLTNGYKVFPFAVEERLRSHPVIADCAVIGHGRDHLVAVIVPAANVDDAAIQRALADTSAQQPAHERVLGFVRADGFSTDNGLRNPNGKILRREIASRFAAALGALHARQ